MKKIVTSTILAVSSIASAFAQYTAVVPSVTTVNDSAIGQFLGLITKITNALIPIAVSLAVLAFFWYLIKFIWYGKEDAESKKVGLAGMGWSVVALFVMVSIWGLVGFLGSITGVGQGGKVPIPGVL